MLKKIKDLDHKKITWILLGLITLAGFFLRAYKVGSLPSGLYPDESVNGIDALQALNAGNFKLFYPNNFGREGLFINLQAIAVHFFGNTTASLRSLSVIFGTIAIVGLYFLAKELFQRRMAGLIAAFLIATSYWAINFSRIGFRAIMTTAVVSFTLYFFLRGMRQKKPWLFLVSGLLFGIGLNTYTAFRAVPFVLIALLPALFLSYKQLFKNYWREALVFVAGFVVTAGPILIFVFLRHPELFNGRANDLSVLSSSVNHGHLLQTLAYTISASLGQYNFHGDTNWRHNFSGQPLLDPLIGIFFLAGLVALLVETFVLIKKRILKKERNLTLARNFTILALFFCMLIPEFMTNEGIPHALRAIGTQAGTFLIATSAILWCVGYAYRQNKETKKFLVGALLLALTFSGAFNIVKYHVLFAQSVEQSQAFNHDYTNMAKYIMSLSADTTKYVYMNGGGIDIDNGLRVTAEPIYFLTYGKAQNVIYIRPNEDIQLIAHNSVIIMQAYDDDLVHRIGTVYSNSRTEHIDLEPGTGSDFTVIEFL